MGTAVTIGNAGPSSFALQLLRDSETADASATLQSDVWKHFGFTVGDTLAALFSR